MLHRALTFRDQGGTDLVWEGGGRAGPLFGSVVHKRYQAPYPVSCSHLVGMVIAGLEYATTTYVIDQNTPAGWRVPLGDTSPVRAQIWQAHRIARFFYRQRSLWLTNGEGIAPGDVLFFSRQNPEGKNADIIAGRQREAYFGNVYHTGIYLGGGRVLHSTGPTSPTGVWDAPLTGDLAATLTWAARPA